MAGMGRAGDNDNGFGCTYLAVETLRSDSLCINYPSDFAFDMKQIRLDFLCQERSSVSEGDFEIAIEIPSV